MNVVERTPHIDGQNQPESGQNLPVYGLETIHQTGQSPPTQLAFVDTRLPDLETLIQGIQADQIILITPEEDGLEVIADRLFGYHDLAAVHIFSHGRTGEVNLGNATLNHDSLNEYGGTLQRWGDALAPLGDLMLYGCNVGADGAAFLQQVSTLTGADVAASNNLTGQGGDWILETTVGSIEASVALSQPIQVSYGGTLAVIGESGTLTDFNQAWTTVTLQQSYNNPVVVVGPPSNQGDNPATVRVRNVTNNSFEMRIDEWEYLDEAHIGESVGYLVAEAGTHTLADGTILQAGGVQTDQTWRSVDFATSFETTPLVFAQTTTEVEASAVAERIRNLTASGFQMSLQEEEAADQLHLDETVGWIAIAPGSGNFGALSYVADTVSSNHQGAIASFNGTFDSPANNPPVFLAQANTANGGDPFALRYRSLDSTAANLFLEEEQSSDSETWHTVETVAYLALEAGLLETTDPSQQKIAHWTFDQTPVNGQTPDTSVFGENHPGDLRNGVEGGSVGGDLGGIVTLDGQDDYIAVADADDINLDIHAKRTVTAWFKVDNKTLFLPNAVAERKQVIYEEGGIGRGLNIYIENGRLYVGGWNQAESNWNGTYLSTNAIESNTWHHVALVLDAAPGSTEVQTDVFSAYLDGVKFGEGQGSQLWAHPGDIGLGAVNVDTQFHDGDRVGTGVETFGGSLAEVAIYNQALSSADIAAQMGLVAQWNFEESSGTQAADTSPAGMDNPGTLINGATFEATGTNLGGSIRFDNPEDYVAIEDTADINLVSHAKRTISTFFKADDIDVAGQKQVIYEEGGTGRGLNIYLENGSLYVGGWNQAESNWDGTYLSTDVIESNTWHHVVLVLDAAPDSTAVQPGVFSAYLDGVQFGEGAGSQLWPHPGDTGLGAVNVDTQFQDGDRVGTGVDGLVGNIADTQIFNRALSGEEIQTIYDNQLSIATETIVSGLAQPEAIDWIPNTDNFLIVEKAGIVKVFENGALLPTPFIDISDQVNNDKFTTRGVTDIAIHPDFEQNPYVYLFFAYDPPEVFDNLDHPFAGPDKSGVRGARVIRVTADASTNYTTAVPNSEVVLLGTNSTWDNYDGFVSPFGANSPIRNNPSGILPDGTNLQDFIAVESNFHNTGSLEFGADGALYVSLGDGSTAILDTGAFRSQDVDNLSGKVLRIDPITGKGLPDNPFFEGDPDANRAKVYQYGLRNPFRIAVHPETGQIFIGDTGWNTWEEVNTGEAGANFGWPYYEGATGENLPTEQFEDLPRSQAFYANPSPVVAPVVALNHVSDGARSVVLGDFYLGDLYPEDYRDDLFFVDATTSIVRNISFDAAGTVAAVDVFTQGAQTVAQVMMGEDGYLYYVDLDDGLVGRWTFSMAAG